MFKRALLTAALAAGLVAGTVTPAQAIPVGDTLIVYAYFDSPAKTQVVGQWWTGCNQPPGHWGVTSGYRTLYFTPC